MATKAESIAALELEIANLTIAINNVRVAGQSWEITSAAGSGTKRVVTFADYATLVKERKELQASLSALNETRGVRLGAGW